MKNMKVNNYAKIEFPEKKWIIDHEPPRCVRVQPRWISKQELSSDSNCVCPFGNKIKKMIDNQTLYECDHTYSDIKK